MLEKIARRLIMPSGHGHSSGGHFGGGLSHSRGGGHFSSSRSSGSRGISFGGRGWHHPHVMVFWGRSVYLGPARAGAVSVLGVLIVLAIIAAVFMGIGWASTQEDLNAIRDDYDYYHNLALDAAEDETLQTVATVTSYKQYQDSGKYMIYYTFGPVDDGFTFYVYDYATARKLKETGVVVALDITNDKITSVTDSVPLDFKDTVLEDDVEYLDYSNMVGFFRTATLIVIGVIVAFIVLAILVPLTAKKATPEQIAENKKTDSNEAKDNQKDGQIAAGTGTWRCGYCKTVNDSSKHACEGCGAQRQN